MAGRLIETIGSKGGVVQQAYDALGNLISSTDARGNQTLYHYDARQRQIETEYADGTLETNHYNAGVRLTAITDVLGHQTAFRYDGESRLTAVVNANGHETRYQYDERGNRTAQIDALGRTTTWRYDDFGRSLGRTLPMGQANAHQYDIFGNRTATTDFNGRTTQFHYDDLGRETQRVYADGQTTVFTYTASGRVATAVDDRGTTTYRYDLRDRLSEVIQPDGTWLRYDYDANSNVIALITPWGETRYSYDAADQRTAVTAPDGSTLNYSYDLAGNRSAIQYPNGLVTRLGYDARNRPIWIETVDPMGTVIARADYTLDARGYRTRIDELGGKVTQYSYDALGRLTAERIDDPILGLRDLSYSYDAAGNRVSKTENGVTTAYQYDANDRLTQAGSDTYTYDANGNTLSRVEAGQITHFVYDGENRLIEATGPFGLQTFAYNVDGIRVADSLNGTETRYLVDANRTYAEVVATYQPGTLGIPAVFDSTVPDATALYSHGQDLAVIQTEAGSYYPHADAQGNITALSGSGSNFTDRYSYDAWGTPLSTSGSTANPYRYSGEWWNPTLGHTYLRARSYNPRIGRFQTMDTWPGRPNEPITLNKYQYANANPAMHTDPSGLFSLKELSVTMSIGGIINASIGAIFSRHGVTTSEFWGEYARNFAIGALTAPVGGVFAKMLAPFARSSLKPLLKLIGKFEKYEARGKNSRGFRRLLINISRFFFTTNKRYPSLKSTFHGKLLTKVFPGVKWEQHHLFIQQSWYRTGGPNQIYKNLLSNRGLQRIGDGLWNIIPISRSLNAKLGQSILKNQMLATAYYSSIVFGPWHMVNELFQGVEHE